MLFNSIAFLVFFPIVVCCYFLLPYRYRWVLLLAASYYFYMCWRVEYIILIMLSTLVDYFVAIKMHELADKKDRRKWLYGSLGVNLGLLFFFKYFNFFGSSANAVLEQFNIIAAFPSLEVLLPVGISFYTFQTLSYSIDVYNDKVEPERHLGRFALYVSFFPQLVAGPIERPARLLPQFRQNFDFDYQRVVQGLKMMAWGFFLKLVIADRLAPMVDVVFREPSAYYGLSILLASFFFAFQIFCDFAGYSIIAIGAAKIMGYDLMENFRRPYLATSIRTFWQRWHISLSTWFKDYVYIPLGGNRVVKWRWYYNLFITFLVSGLWHGANWTFVVWGALHGLFLIVAIVTQEMREKLVQGVGLGSDNKILKVGQILSTFLLVCLAWIFFRANSLTDAFVLIGHLFDFSHTTNWALIPGFANLDILVALGLIGLLVFIQVLEEWGISPNPLYHNSPIVRWAAYIILVTLIVGFGVFTSKEFIYFQF